MKKVWYILGGLALLIGIVIIGGMNGLSAVKGLEISDVDLSRVADGVHEGTFKHTRWDYRVAVTVKDHRIIAVDLQSPKNVATNRLASIESGRVLEAQSPNVDTVSGATATCKALLKAIENALTK